MQYVRPPSQQCRGRQWHATSLSSPYKVFSLSHCHLSLSLSHGDEYAFACSPVSGWVKSHRLSFFGHFACMAPEEDHHHVTAATLRPPANCRRPVGCPRTIWLRTIDDDLQSLNFWVQTAWRKARDIDVRYQVVSSATLP